MTARLNRGVMFLQNEDKRLQRRVVERYEVACMSRKQKGREHDDIQDFRK